MSFSLRFSTAPPPPTVRSTLIRRPFMAEWCSRSAVCTSDSESNSTNAVPLEVPSRSVRRRTCTPPTTPLALKWRRMSAAVALYGNWPTKSVHEIRSAKLPWRRSLVPSVAAAKAPWESSSSSSHAVLTAAAAGSFSEADAGSAGAARANRRDLLAGIRGLSHERPRRLMSSQV